MVSRRQFISRTALAGSALLMGRASRAEAQEASRIADQVDASRAPAGDEPQARGAKARTSAYVPVTTPNGTTLPYRVVDGVKVFHLVAAAVKYEFTSGPSAECWGYNGASPGPTIEAVEGDRVRFYVTNKLPEPTSLHWHGLLLPNGMDGVGGLTQPYIREGETFRYESTLKNHGTFMYHPHVDEMTQMAMGMMGMFIVHPKRLSRERRVDRDFALILSEFSVPIGTARPDPREMVDFNVLTINGKAFPGTAPLVARTGQRVRIRMGNLSAMHNHPIHLHGYSLRVTATDGGVLPPSAQWRETTVLVPVGATRDAELLADAPGDWAMHCHFTHHVMNQMGHGGHNVLGMERGDFDKRMRKVVPGYMTMGHDGMAAMATMRMKVPDNSIPMYGTEGKYDYIDMGGMFTVLKVRDGLSSYEDPGWYEQPEGSMARVATADELAADGVEPGGSGWRTSGRASRGHAQRAGSARSKSNSSPLSTPSRVSALCPRSEAPSPARRSVSPTRTLPLATCSHALRPGASVCVTRCPSSSRLAYRSTS